MTTLTRQEYEEMWYAYNAKIHPDRPIRGVHGLAAPIAEIAMAAFEGGSPTTMRRPDIISIATMVLRSRSDTKRASDDEIRIGAEGMAQLFSNFCNCCEFQCAAAATKIRAWLRTTPDPEGVAYRRALDEGIIRIVTDYVTGVQL